MEFGVPILKRFLAKLIQKNKTEIKGYNDERYDVCSSLLWTLYRLNLGTDDIYPSDLYNIMYNVVKNQG
jgi:uncharacterized protein YycO